MAHTSIFEGVLSDYHAQLERRRTFRVLLQRYTNVPDEPSFIKIQPLARFTERYMKRVYYQIAPLKHLRPTAFLTFTFPADDYDRLYQYEAALQEQRKAWTKIRAWIKKFLPGTFTYFRVYELTQKNNLHIHCLVFSEWTKEELAKLAMYAHNNIGFIDVKRFTYDSKFTYTWKYWINDNSVNRWQCQKVTETFPTRPDGSKGSDYNAVTNYVMKYQMKEPSLLHQALMTKYRIRTYSISQNLRFMINKITSKKEWAKLHADYTNPILDPEEPKKIPGSPLMTTDEKKQLAILIKATMDVSIRSLIKYIDEDYSGSSMLHRYVKNSIPKPKYRKDLRHIYTGYRSASRSRIKVKLLQFPVHRIPSFTQYLNISMGLSLFIDEVRMSSSFG